MRWVLSIALFLICFISNAQITWDFATAAPTSGVPSNITVADLSRGNNNGTTTLLTTNSGSTGYAGASGGNNAGTAALTGAFDSTTSAYFEILLTPATGFAVRVTKIEFGSRSTSTGPQAYTLRADKDGYSFEWASETLANNSSWALKTPPTFYLVGNMSTPLKLRIFGYNGTGNPSSGTANWRIDDLKITADAVATLPVQLAQFTGALVNSQAKLIWSTASEVDFSHFEIERSNDFSGHFYKIGQIKASGKANGNTYQMMDALSKGIYQYRLKMVDNNGSYQYSKVLVLNNQESLKYQVYPNPVMNTLRVTHEKAEKGSSMKIVNAEGKILQSFWVQEGAMQTTIQLQPLLNGSYWILFENANKGRATTQFIKQ